MIVFRRIVFAAFWVGYAWFGYLIILSSLPYFGEAGRWHPFLTESALKRQLAQNAWYFFALRLHVVGGAICLAAILIQFSPFLLKRFRGLHRWSGRLYGVAALLLVCLPGMPMALFAKGGTAGQLGFLALGVLTFWTTWMGIKEARRRKFVAHREWMIRSFALVASAITFRLIQIGLYQFFTLADDAIYVVSLYVSTFGNVAAAEFTILLTRKHKPKTRHETDHQNRTHINTDSGGSPDPSGTLAG